MNQAHALGVFYCFDLTSSDHLFILRIVNDEFYTLSYILIFPGL